MAKKPVTKAKTAELAKHPAEEKHDGLAARVITAVTELNDAIKAVDEDGDGTLAFVQRHGEGNKMRFAAQVYRMTHAAMLFTIEYEGKQKDQA